MSGADATSLRWTRLWLRRAAWAMALVLATVFVVRAIDAWRAPPLKLWHTVVPSELDAREIDAADWAAWMRAEDAAFEDVARRVSAALPDEDRVAANRYFTGSPMNATHFGTDWNRSVVLMPDGQPQGAVVLLHGLTDSPYSLRHLAAAYREHGFVAVAIRMPAHGTVPGALTRVRWEAWLAATRLAVRHARELAGNEVPLHLVGYSNGAALALDYSLIALEDRELPRADQLVLLSPMIGITSFARFAGVLGWPALFPPFAKAAWLETLPEYNPFKYTSFPVNAARQSSQLVREVQDALVARADDGKLAQLPPILTFQSAIDSTVSSSALVSDLYAVLPANGSELVLFDRNHAAEAGALLKPALAEPAAGLLPPAPRRFTVTLVTNASGGVEARSVAAGSAAEKRVALAESYPPDLYSLSHVALPFPPDDALYGGMPAAAESFGVNLGAAAVRGERGSLVVGAETLMRASYNPFFGYLLERIAETMPR